MVVHTCERCLCTFDKKCAFDYHKKRKIQCKVIEQKGGGEELQIVITEINKMKEQIKDQDKQMNKMNKQINELNKINTKLQCELNKTNKKLQCELNKTNTTISNILNGSQMTDIVDLPKRKKNKIPKSLKTKVWNENFGKSCGEHMCYVGCGKMIYQSDFECGHIVAEINGGDMNIDNLKPICGQCNKSMGTMNLEKFKAKYFDLSDSDESINDNIVVSSNKKSKRKTIVNTNNKI
jgi:5-methylcytosine-specific restriction endonuclease McrA